MAYSSNDDLLKEMSAFELAVLAGDPTGLYIDTYRTTHARLSADLLIDSYLSARYSLPFEAVSDPVINQLSNTLTLANLYDYAYQKTAVPFTITQRKSEALKLLEDLKDGNASLKTSSLQAIAPPEILSNKTAEKTFNNNIIQIYLT